VPKSTPETEPFKDPLFNPPTFRQLSAPELAARQRRNVWIALGLIAFMVLLFTTTFLRMMHNQADARSHQSAPVGSIDR
jgi:hypothetical protein